MKHTKRCNLPEGIQWLRSVVVGIYVDMRVLGKYCARSTTKSGTNEEDFDSEAMAKGYSQWPTMTPGQQQILAAAEPTPFYTRFKRAHGPRAFIGRLAAQTRVSVHRWIKRCLSSSPLPEVEISLWYLLCACYLPDR